MWDMCENGGSPNKHFVGVLSVGMAPGEEQSHPCGMCKGMCKNLWYIVYRGGHEHKYNACYQQMALLQEP
jgi:hypothetical protein